MDQLSPIYRIEFFLDAIVNGTQHDLEPIYRVEFFLAKIAGEVVEIPAPLSRMEMFLAQLCGETVTLPTPQSRTEQYLAAICGEDVEIPPFPVYRIEYWLDQWAQGGGSEIVQVTGIDPLLLPSAVFHPLKSLTQYGLCVQSGTPTLDAPVDIVCNNGALKYSANMANVNSTTVSVGYYIASNGTVTADSNNWFCQAYILVQPNTTYTLSFDTNVYYVTISEYATAEDSGFIVRKAGSAGSNTQLTITTEATTNYIRFGTNINRDVVTLDRVLAIHWMLAQSATAQSYRPYGEIYADGTPEVLTITADGAETQTVNDIPMLLAVGGTSDELEFILGPLTRRIKLKIVTGTETDAWAVQSNRVYAGKTALGMSDARNETQLMCTISSYSGTGINTYGNVLIYGDWAGAGIDTVEKLNAFFAARFAAGKPVILAYCATETTEQGTAHSLHTSAGTNVVDVTSNVDPVTLSVEYAKEAS